MLFSPTTSADVPTQNKPNSPYLLKTSWGQRNEYAKFSPNHERLGCWSTALAQILYFHRLKPTGVTQYTCKNGCCVKEDFDTYNFKWELFVNEFGKGTPTTSKDEVARFIYFVSVAIQKDFGTGDYVLNHAQRTKAIAQHFTCETKLFDGNKYSLAEIKQVIIQEITAGRPVMMHLKDLSDKNYHAVAVDGYNIKQDKCFIHVNIGHEGSDNGWYDFALPILKYNDNNYREIMTVKLTESRHQ
jgi:hypothetical protein